LTEKGEEAVSMRIIRTEFTDPEIIRSVTGTETQNITGLLLTNPSICR